MTNLKKPEDYLDSLYPGKQGSNRFVIRQDIVDLIKQAQKEAYNQAIDDAVENVKLDRDGKLLGDEYFIEKYNTYYKDTVIDINKNSILKLKIE